MLQILSISCKNKIKSFTVGNIFILISPIWDLFLMNCEIRRGIFQNQVKLYFKKQDSEMEIATQNSSSISFIAITHFPQKYNAKLQTAKSLINKKTKISQL